MATEIPIKDLTRGAVDRVRGALFHHIVIAYLYALPMLILAIPGAFDSLLLVLMRRQPPQTLQFDAFVFAVLLLLWGSFVLTSWYRLALIGPYEYLRIDLGALLRRTGKFLLLSLGVGAMAAAMFITVSTILGFIGVLTGDVGRGFFATIGVPLAVGSALALALRFLPSLAAPTLGRSVRFGDSWRLTAGQGGRILMVALMLIIPAVLISGIVDGVITQAFLGTFDKQSPDATALRWIRGSLTVTVALAPLSGAANAFIAGLAAELYARLVGPPLDARGMEV